MRKAARIVGQDLQADRPAQAVHATDKRDDEAFAVGRATRSGVCCIAHGGGRTLPPEPPCCRAR